MNPTLGIKRNFEGASAEAIVSLEPVVQNKQDCPEDSGHWELFKEAIESKTRLDGEGYAAGRLRPLDVQDEES